MITIKHLDYAIEKQFILEKIHLTIQKGRIHGIIGPNGAGKSTLLKHIMRILDPPKATVFVDGQDVTQYKVKAYARTCSFVFQENMRDVDFSVEEMIAMGRYPYLDLLGQPQEEDRLIVDQILQDLKIDHLKKRSIRSLSGGEAQKVFIGRALAQKTSLLLLDEPTSMLDIHNSIELLTLLHTIKAKYELTIVMVMHDLNLTFQFCDDVTLLQKGKVVLNDTATKVLESEQLKAVYHHKIKVISEDGRSYVVPNLI